MPSTFSEINTVEAFIVKRLSGVDINAITPQQQVGETRVPYGYGYTYRTATQLNGPEDRAFDEMVLRESLIRLNPDIAAEPRRAEEVIHRLRAIVNTVGTEGLVSANEHMMSYLLGERSMAFGEGGAHVSVKLIDFDHPERNRYVITNQYRITSRETKIPDIVLLVNGLPLVVGEAKSATRPSVSYLDAAHDIVNVYEPAVPALFVCNVFSFATEGKELYYGAVGTPLQYWSPWRLEDRPGELARRLGLGGVGEQLEDLLHPDRVLSILRDFTLFTTNNKKRRIKVVCRYQQYEAAQKIAARVLDGRVRKGLIWHFQGSGKSLLMLFTAKLLRRLPELRSPTILILVDRTDLDSQITGTFSAADVPNVQTTDSIEELRTLLAQGIRKIIVTTIHKFRDAPARLNGSANLIVLVDEAHRTQEGDLGRMMRDALPNAFLFGLTGTPINRVDKNTFYAFGADEDEAGYLSRYTYQDSLRDGATLPLHFEPRLLDVHIDAEQLDEVFESFREESALDDMQADALGKRSAKMRAFLTAPERVEKIVVDIVRHYREKVEPRGLKAMIVTSDRHACVQYKELLDQHLPSEASRVVISTGASDPLEFKQRWATTKDQQEKIVEAFNDADGPLKFLIVTAKLLTGFDAPILQTMYLDKSLKDHTLLQAVTRSNRTYPNKHFGAIVDYFGVFDDAARALAFDEPGMKKVVTQLSGLSAKLPGAMAAALSHFPDVDRTIEGFDGLEAAQEAIRGDEAKDAFAANYKALNRLWESLSPTSVLTPYLVDYTWLSNVYDSVRPSADNLGKLLWFALGPETTKLLHAHVRVGEVHQLDEFILDAEVVDGIMSNPTKEQRDELEQQLVRRFQRHAGLPEFKKLSERLEALRDKAERGLIMSIEFVKELCKLAKDTIQAEKELEADKREKSPAAALTELFLELKTDQTPAVVERIVTEIDQIVKVVRFPSWQTTSSGEREVQKALRKALLKYKLHKDQVLFERAYGYIKEYY